MPGRRSVDCWLEGFTIGGGGLGRTVDWLTTALSWLGCALTVLLSGCQVRRRQASSGLLDMDSRRDQPEVDAVGDDIRLLLAGEKPPALEAFMEPGPNIGRPTGNP